MMDRDECLRLMRLIHDRKVVEDGWRKFKSDAPDQMPPWLMSALHDVFFQSASQLYHLILNVTEAHAAGQPISGFDLMDSLREELESFVLQMHLRAMPAAGEA